jgi:DNA-binding SARP family transcriptional activator
MTLECYNLQWRVLGPFEVTVGGRPVEFGGPQLRAVLARLVAAAGRTVSVGALAMELWADSPPDDAYRTVRTYVSRLRAALCRAAGAGAGELLVTRAPGYQLWADPATVDAARFERLAASGHDALRADQPQLAIGRLTAALDLWRGDAFAEFHDHPAIRSEGVRLERLRLAAIEARIGAELDLGLDTHLVDELEALVRAFPTRELLWGYLMIALYRVGRQVEALAAFRTVRALLIADHGVEPSPRLVDLHRQILHHDARLAPVWQAQTAG